MYHARTHKMCEANDHGEQHGKEADPHVMEPVWPKNWVEAAMDSVHFDCCMDVKFEGWRRVEVSRSQRRLQQQD
jgi:hypothetical protein